MAEGNSVLEEIRIILCERVVPRECGGGLQKLTVR